MNERTVQLSWAASAFLVLVLIASCAGKSALVQGTDPLHGCERFFIQLDDAVDRGGVRDAGDHRFAGAPYLRVSRFLASFASVDAHAERRAEWLERLRALDAHARLREIVNLDDERAIQAIRSPFPGLEPAAVIRECGKRLLARDLAAPARFEQLAKLAAVPPEYSRWRRALGIYPLTRLVFERGIAALHRRLRADLAAQPFVLPHQRPWLRYVPAPWPMLPEQEAVEIIRKATSNPLEIPDPQPDQLRQLFGFYAPLFEVETRTADDRIGSPYWQDEERLAVRTDRAVVYRFVSHTRFRGASALQLNYQIWFPRRPASGWFDLDAGELDGLIWRVTLAPWGGVLAYDSIHACGSRYQVFPGPGYRVQQPGSDQQPVLSPYPLVRLADGERWVIRISGGSHEIQAVHADLPVPGSIGYDWREYESLLNMVDKSGGRRSLFDPNGRVPGTTRLQRWLFWPSGIDSPGAQRQRGRQPIALVGQRHFDDPDLLDALLKPM